MDCAARPINTTLVSFVNSHKKGWPMFIGHPFLIIAIRYLPFIIAEASRASARILL